jgi:hypothetical protein
MRIIKTYAPISFLLCVVLLAPIIIGIGIMSPAFAYYSLVLHLLIKAYIAFIISKNITNLGEFALDRASIITFILFCFLRPNYQLPGESWIGLLNICIGAFSSIIFIKHWREIPNVTYKGLFFGILLSICLFLVVFPLSLTTDHIYSRVDGYKNVPVWIIVFREVITTLSYTVIFEEFFIVRLYGLCSNVLVSIILWHAFLKVCFFGSFTFCAMASLLSFLLSFHY